jgi:hypothetical protein
MRVLLILVGGLSLWGASVADNAVAHQMRSWDPDVYHVRVLKREAIDGEMDLVVAFGRPKQRVDGKTGWVSWDEQTRIGLFLQRQDEAGTVYRIAIEKGMADGQCLARLERVSTTDVVIGCKPEKPSPGMHRKFVFDLRAKRLVKFFEYVPFSVERVRVAEDRVIWTGRNDSRRVEMILHSDGAWDVNSLGAAEQKSRAKRVLRFGATGEFQVTEDTAEVVEHKNGRKFRLKQVVGEEHIGPWQVESTKLWFGKTFYDGEGMTGKGGFGYFDAEKRGFQMFSPDAMKRASVSSILVEAVRIWFGLVHNGEYGPSSMGMIEYDRSTEKTRKIDVAGVIHGIARYGEKIVMATEFGAVVWDGQKVRRYFVDQTSDGRLRVVEGIAVP